MCRLDDFHCEDKCVERQGLYEPCYDCIDCKKGWMSTCMNTLYNHIN